MVGTMVRDRTYEASTANTTAIASGRNSAAAGPVRKNIGTNTIEMEIVETNAGVAIWAAPSMMAGRISFPCSMFRLMFSIVTVASSTRIPTASANPLSVITLSVWPRAARPMIEHSTASGIDVAMMSVLRQLPRKEEDHQGREASRDDSFTDDPRDRGPHEQRLIHEQLNVERRRQRGLERREQGLHAVDH